MAANVLGRRRICGLFQGNVLQLRYTGDVVELQGGMPEVNSSDVAYVRLAHPLTYCADGMYGFNVEPGQFPQNHGGVVYHTLQALDAARFDFAPYANPATNVVENLIVVFAGSAYSQTGDADNSLEATAYRLVWAGAREYVSADGYSFDNYTFCPDLCTAAVARNHIAPS